MAELQCTGDMLFSPPNQPFKSIQCLLFFINIFLHKYLNMME